METMTTKEVAKSLNVNIKTIQRLVKKLFPELIKHGINTKLNEIQVTAIKLKLDKNYSIDTDVELPKTELEKELIIYQGMVLQQEKINRLTIQLEEAKPKIEFFDNVTSSKDTMDMKEVSKLLKEFNMGRNNLFKFLRKKKILMANNTPYQKYVDRGYFKIVESEWDIDDETHINVKTVVYQKGIDFIRKLLKNREE